MPRTLITPSRLNETLTQSDHWPLAYLHWELALLEAFESEFPGKVRAKNVDATIETSVAAVEKLGFKRHGLAIYGPDGEPLFKQADHTVDVAAVRKRLSELL